MLHRVIFFRSTAQRSATRPDGHSPSERFPVPLIRSPQGRILGFFKKLCPPATAQQMLETLWQEATIFGERH